MTTKHLSYKGYLGSIDFDVNEAVIFGKVLFIKDTITYEAVDLPSLQKEFEAAIDDYLETCNQLNRQPQKTFKGSFNVRVGEELHRNAALYAEMRGQNLNDFCKEAIEEKIETLRNGNTEKQTVVRTTLLVENIIKDTESNSTMRGEYITVAEDCNHSGI
ncbi:type II toxin-antitoxin system HicB family antitoxin [Desulfogranum marinum]|uniref:type II toxin-antitoxin system HicB family antitoxin n=1 Tax=Desulfogranum marinum TaxID=453220 RepID=UPI001962D556|nr:type II toxin-antitoxin system HicB family antitoxin [Desulfogranum marinum]MBM9512880.1 type II toxin-antitoxin system HicB family antitoxin [Desulfogranum marinum]